MRLAIRLQRRVEARAEERVELTRQLRVAGQGLLHVGLTEGERSLPHMLRIRSQHADFTPGQAGQQDQAVEIVVFHLAAPHAAESVVKQRLNVMDIEGLGRAEAEAEIVQPDHAAVLAHDLRGALVHHLHPHALEHGQALRQRHGGIEVIDAEVDAVGCPLERAVEIHAQLTGTAQAFDLLDVKHRHARAVVLAVPRGEALAVATQQRQPALLATLFDQGLAQGVLPGPRGTDQALLEFADIKGRNDRIARAHDDLNAGQRRIGELHVKL